MASPFLLIAILFFNLILFGYYSPRANAQESGSPGMPTVNDPNLKVEVVFDGIKFPTSMAFLGPDDILVLEKNNGTVQRIVNGQMLDEPLLDVNVANDVERGMLGIAVSKSNTGNIYVFLYYTESKTKDGDDVRKGKEPLGNRLFRYELVNNKLVNPKLLLDLPATPGPKHNGGVLVVGPDNDIYLVVGDMLGQKSKSTMTKAQNFKNGTNPDGRAGILRVTQDGKAVEKGILGNTSPLNLYYAYGIRNSFGMDFDPVTGNLWDTENGPWYGDEINLVRPGFNSGWMAVQGVWKPEGNIAGETSLVPDNLEDFGGKGRYSAPEFIWNNTVGPSAIKFLDSDKLGKQYMNDLFVGDVNNKNIYHFDLNKARTNLSLNGPLKDTIANTPEELKDLIFAQGFDRITGMEVGPDGYLYIVSDHGYIDPSNVEGTIYKIVPAS